MGSLFEELEAREAAARVRVEELEAELASLSARLEKSWKDLERLRITRETVTEVLAEMTSEAPVAPSATDQSPAGDAVGSACAGVSRQVIGVLTVPNWQPGMKPYDTHVTADPFARSISAFEALTGTLSGGDASRWTHAELEEHLEAAGREPLRLLMQDHLDLRARREEKQVRSGAGPVVVGPEGRMRPWRETGHSRRLAGVFGLVRVTRVSAYERKAPARYE